MSPRIRPLVTFNVRRRMQPLAVDVLLPVAYHPRRPIPYLLLPQTAPDYVLPEAQFLRSEGSEAV